MTYKCGHINWTDHDATIGFSASPDFFENHPLSGTSSVTEIDCLDHPKSVWTNLIYKISEGIHVYMVGYMYYDYLYIGIKCLPKCINGLCVSTNVCLCEEGWTGLACDQCMFLKSLLLRDNAVFRSLCTKLCQWKMYWP